MLIGGCDEKGSKKSERHDDKNSLEEYASNLLFSLNKAQKGQLHASLPMLRLKINRFRQEKGRYPHSLEELQISDPPLRLLRYDPVTGEVSVEE